MNKDLSRIAGRLTQKELKEFNNILDSLDSLYNQKNVDLEELDMLYRGVVDSMIAYAFK